MLMTKTAKLLSAAGIAALVLGASPVRAAPAPPDPPPTSQRSPSDSTLLALLGGVVALELAGGGERTGVLVEVAPNAVTLISPSDERTVVPRADVSGVRVNELPPVTDAELAAASGDKVWLRERDGRVESGELLSFSPDAITLVGDDTAVTSVARGEVVAMGRQASRRRFGLNVSLLPGVMIDADVGLFRAYLSGSILFPAVVDGKIWGFSTGLGVNIPISRRVPQLKVDVLAHANLMGVVSACSACNYPTAHVLGFGVAAGVHTTLDSGFTVGATLPIIGYSVTPSYEGTENARVGYYYLSSAIGMPLAFMGYRF